MSGYKEVQEYRAGRNCNNHMIKTILFDFDGTVADTMETIGKILNNLSTKYGYQQLTVEEQNAMRDYTIQEIFKKTNVPFYKLPFMVHDVKKELNKYIGSLKPVPGMKEVLKELKKREYTLAIITSNDKRNVHVFLDNNNLHYFDAIHTGTALLGKARVIQGFLKKKHIPLEQAIYIGDEIRDIVATKKIGIPIISCTWGLNSKKGLQKFNPDFIVDTPKEILTSL